MHRQIITVIGPSISYVPLTRGLFARISSDKGPLVRNHNWSSFWSVCGKCFYAGRTVGEGKTIYMHKIIHPVEDGFYVDHKDGDTLNDEDRNLRTATRSQNAMNRRKRSDNTSGFKGVSLHRESGKWRSLIYVSGEKISLGLFISASDAHAAYCQAAAKLHGEFSRGY